ncbi:MAG: hypothetical protein ACR2IP_04535 [Solirubrobacteraceae bacterium]
MRPRAEHLSTAAVLPITIRPAYADDELALARLAALDSAAAAPSRPLLLAEIEGELRVALSLRDGSAIADPFFATAGLLALLRVHAAGDAPRAPRRDRLLPARAKKSIWKRRSRGRRVLA